MASLKTEVEHIKQRITVCEGELQQLKQGQTASSEREVQQMKPGKIASLEGELQQLKQGQIASLERELLQLKQGKIALSEVELLQLKQGKIALSEVELQQLREGEIALSEVELQQLRQGEIASSEGELKMSPLEEQLEQLKEEKIAMLNKDRKNLLEISLLKRDIVILTSTKNRLLAEKQYVGQANFALARKLEEVTHKHLALVDLYQRSNQLLTLEQLRHREQTQLAHRLIQHLDNLNAERDQEKHSALVECQATLETRFEDKLTSLRKDLRATLSELDIEKFQNVQLRNENSALKAQLNEINLTYMTEELTKVGTSGHARPNSSVPESG